MQQGNKVGRGNNVENGGVGPKRFIREETPTCPFWIFVFIMNDRKR